MPCSFRTRCTAWLKVASNATYQNLARLHGSLRASPRIACRRTSSKAVRSTRPGPALTVLLARRELLGLWDLCKLGQLLRRQAHEIRVACEAWHRMIHTGSGKSAPFSGSRSPSVSGINLFNANHFLEFGFVDKSIQSFELARHEFKGLLGKHIYISTYIVGVHVHLPCRKWVRT